jgi:hypothetical protein
MGTRRGKDIIRAGSMVGHHRARICRRKGVEIDRQKGGVAIRSAGIGRRQPWKRH